MDVTLAVLADCANLSQEGKLNIMGIFDNVFVQSMPGTVAPCFLVLRWKADAAEKGLHKELQFRLMDPDGKLLVETAAHLQIPRDERPGEARLNMILPFPLCFEQYGPHRLCILVNGETKTDIDIATLPTSTPSAE